MRGRQLLALSLVLLAGLYVSDQIFLQKRGIASLEGAVSSETKNENFDLTGLQGKEFDRAFKKALVQGIQLHKTNSTLGLSWGQFLISNASGGKVYACDKYPYFEMTLQAEGVAYSGNIPTIIVRGPCVSSDDGKSIQALDIPLQGLHGHLTESSIYRVDLGQRGDSLLLSAQNLYNEWPKYWNVTGVTLSNDTEKLSIDGYEIISLLDQPLTLDFAEDQ